MRIPAESGHGRIGRAKKWATAAAASAAFVAAVITAVVAGGTPLGSSPVASADPVTATPWVPLPVFGPKHAKQPRSAVTSQGGSQASAQSQANDKGAKWIAKASKPFNAINEQVKNLYDAFGAQDVGAVKTACRNLSGAGQDLAGTLPSPNDEVTTESQGLVDDIAGLSSACLSGDQPDTAAMQKHATGIADHMSRLAKLTQGG